MEKVDILSLDKFQRSLLLRKYNINTIEMWYIRKGDYKKGSESKLLNQIAKWKKADKVKCGFSVRTQARPDISRYQLPFHTGIQGLVELHRVIKNLNEEYTVMVYPTINPQDVLLNANFVMDADGEVIVEYSDKKGITVRDLENETLKQLKFTIPIIKPGGVIRVDTEEFTKNLEHLLSIGKIAEKIFRSSFPIIDKIIFECSVYPYPIGILEQKTIIWDFRRFK